MAKKPSFRDSKEYQNFLKKVGYKKTKKSKSIRQAFEDSGASKIGRASSYYSDTGQVLDIKKPTKNDNRMDFSNESKKTTREIERKNNLIRAISMPAPRDLSDDHPERIIDQKHLITPRG